MTSDTLATHPVLNNTKVFCLQLLAGSTWLTAYNIAQARWPQSKQLGKKEITIIAHLQRMAEAGYVRIVASESPCLYAITTYGMDELRKLKKIPIIPKLKIMTGE